MFDTPKRIKKIKALNSRLNDRLMELEIQTAGRRIKETERLEIMALKKQMQTNKLLLKRLNQGGNENV